MKRDSILWGRLSRTGSEIDRSGLSSTASPKTRPKRRHVGRLSGNKYNDARGGCGPVGIVALAGIGPLSPGSVCLSPLDALSLSLDADVPCPPATSTSYSEHTGTLVYDRHDSLRTITNTYGSLSRPLARVSSAPVSLSSSMVTRSLRPTAVPFPSADIRSKSVSRPVGHRAPS